MAIDPVALGSGCIAALALAVAWRAMRANEGQTDLTLHAQHLHEIEVLHGAHIATLQLQAQQAGERARTAELHVEMCDRMLKRLDEQFAVLEARQNAHQQGTS